LLCALLWGPLSAVEAQPVPGPGNRTLPGGIVRPQRGQGLPGGRTVGPLPGAPPTSPATPDGTGTPGEPLITIPPPPSSGTNAPGEDIIPAGVIRFPAVDLNQVLKVYAELVGRTVLRPTTLPAPTITLETVTPLTRSEARAAIDAVLALNGIAVVDVGDKFVEVVPASQVGQVGAPFSTESAEQLANLGPYVTHVVQTHYVKPSELQSALTPFASAGMANGILPIDSSQILVLRDYSQNVKRMLEMIKRIDVAVPSEYVSEVIPIKYALASEIANALNSLSSGGGGTTVGGGSTMTGGNIARPGYGGGFGSRMGYGGGYGSSYGGGYGSSYGRTGYGGYGSYGTTPYSSSITPLATLAPGATTGAGSTFSDRLRNIIQKASKEGEIQVLGQTKIIADERTNSLLIFASREDMKTIKDIVAKLDVVLAQVLIEAVIIEVTLNDSHSLGISYLQNQPSTVGNYLSGIGAINNNNLLSRSSFVQVGTGTNVAGNVPQGFSYLASLGNDLDVSLTALAGNSRARILQRPRIQTSHAVPAVLFVGQSRPYPTGSYYGGGAYGGYSTIQQLQIGVTLSVTPLINPDGLVVMDIDQQIDSFQGNVTIQGVGDVPVTSSKHATAKVAVRDRDTIMLGGLIENTKNNSNSGVPFLKDIPLLGHLFRSSSQDSSRDELIVLIRPTVLPTPEVAALTAKAEQKKMPEINRMQAEIEASEAQRVKNANKQLNKRP